MGALNSYLQQTQRLVGDVKQELFNLDDLKVYVNLAREQVAAEGQCVRWLTPPAAGVAMVSPVAIGSGYTHATVAIAPPDVPGITAQATAHIVGGEITSYTVTNPGSGYLYIPGVTVSGDGSFATAVAGLQFTMQFLQEQEVFSLADVPVATLKPGADSILAVLNLSAIWQNVRYSGNQTSFSKMQGLIRAYTNPNFLYTPFWFAQYEQGNALSFYLYPVPDQNYPAEIDTLLLPADLNLDGDIELIPKPWRAAVPFYAAYLALLSTNEPPRVALAFRYFNEQNGGMFNMMMRRARAFSQPRLVSSWYGRNIS